MVRGMRIRVLFFAALRERAGVSDLELELSEDATVGDALAALSQRFPHLGVPGPGVRCAVEREFCDASRPLVEGQELALLPPVSGG